MPENPPDHINASRREYQRRINRAQDYIERHLGTPLTLAEIARAACFSPYHFHRLYTALTGEPLHAFIRRVRLERAANLLRMHPERSITDIALHCGFASSAAFARVFRAASGCSAREYRKQAQTARQDGQKPILFSTYATDLAFSPSLRTPHLPDGPSIQPLALHVRPLAARTLAYVRHVGPYASDCALFERLFGEVVAWAEPRGLIGAPPELIATFHDNPEITATDKLRISVGLVVPPATPTHGRINLLELSAGNYACARFELDPEDYPAAWRHLCAEWLPQSGWQPADFGLCHESYLNDPKVHPEGKHLVEIRVPVQPL